MREWLLFLASISNELYDLFQYVTSGAKGPTEYEQQLAMRIIRKASDEQARREITGA